MLCEICGYNCANYKNAMTLQNGISADYFSPDSLDYSETEIIEGIDLLREASVQILVLRHGESTSNLAQELNRPDDKLTEKGERQAAALGRLLGQGYGSNLDAVFVSPLERARQTAQNIFGAHIPETRFFASKFLVERQFKELEGVAYSKIPELALAHGGEANLIRLGPNRNYIRSGYGIEEFSDLKIRSGRFMAKVGYSLEQLGIQHQRIAVVSHGDLSHMIIANWLKIDDVEHILRNYGMPNAGGYILSGNEISAKILNPIEG